MARVQSKGRVVDAGGGTIRLLVDRGLDYYPTINTMVDLSWERPPLHGELALKASQAIQKVLPGMPVEFCDQMAETAITAAGL